MNNEERIWVSRFFTNLMLASILVVLIFILVGLRDLSGTIGTEAGKLKTIKPYIHSLTWNVSAGNSDIIIVEKKEDEDGDD